MNDSTLGCFLAIPGGLLLAAGSWWAAGGKSDNALALFVAWVAFSALEAGRFGPRLRRRSDDTLLFWKLSLVSSLKIGALLGLAVGTASALHRGPDPWSAWLRVMAPQVAMATGMGILAGLALFVTLLGGPLWAWGLRKNRAGDDGRAVPSAPALEAIDTGQSSVC